MGKNISSEKNKQKNGNENEGVVFAAFLNFTHCKFKFREREEGEKLFSGQRKTRRREASKALGSQTAGVLLGSTLFAPDLLKILTVLSILHGDVLLGPAKGGELSEEVAISTLEEV